MKEKEEKSPEKEIEEEINAKTLLVPADKYLKSGAHIGTRFKSGDMKKYIYKMRPDGLSVLDVQTLDERIRIAAQLIAKLPAERIAVISRRLYGQTAVAKFAEITGVKALNGRFIPGTFTNANSQRFFEPMLIIATEPESDSQAIQEAAKVKSTVIGICSTNNSTKNIDLVIPANNKGRKSLALIYWLLAREVLKARETISRDEDFGRGIEEFEHKITESENMLDEEGEERKRFGKRRFGQDNDRDRRQGFRKPERRGRR